MATEGTTSWSTLRAAFATQIETVTGTGASRQPISLSNVPSGLATIPYSIGIDSQNDTQKSRNRPGRPANVLTVVTVTLARKLQIDAQVATYDTALDNAQDIIEAVIDPTALDLRASHVFFDRMSSAVAPSGEWAIVTLRFVAGHMLNLQK